MNGRVRWLFAFAGTLALAVLLLGALLGGAPAIAPATASPPDVVPSPTLPSPTVTPSPTTGPVASYWVYFARDQLPPVGAAVQAIVSTGPQERIARRLETLMQAGAPLAPAGATNPAALIRRHTTVSGGFTQAAPGVSAVRIEGDLASVEFDIVDWGVRGAAVTQGLVQQLVYTITEEEGIRRARITEKGKATATIDQLVVDKPLAREDVSGYSLRGSEVASIENAGDGQAQDITTWAISNDPIATLGRLSLEVRAFSPPLEGGATPTPGRLDPTFKAELKAGATGSKGRITLTLPAVRHPASPTSVTNAGAGPIRGVDLQVLTSTCPPTGPCPRPVLMTIELDDARPWRVTVEPSGPRSARVNVDVGGRPEWINENIAVYSVEPSGTSRGIRVRGAARVFEANVSWRIVGKSGGIDFRGNATATVGTSSVWGAFDFTVESPGPVPDRLEVYWASPRDGTDQDVVAIPLGGP